MSNKLLEENAKDYAKLSGMTLNLERPLGFGNDGSVWKSSRNTAVKALESKRKYSIEVECYKRFKTAGVTSLDGFAVPQLFGHDDGLFVIEMGIVTALFILDFAKAWLDRPGYTAEELEQWDTDSAELFGERWPTVRGLLYGLRRFGIFYYDAKPANIRFDEIFDDG
jgi:hypothetical protein